MKTTDAARADHSARRDDSGRGKQTAVGTASARGFEARGESEGRDGGRGLDRPRPADAPVLELPWDHARPQRPGSGTAAHPFSLDTALTARLVKLAARERVTLATTLVASVAALLHRYTGEEQVCLGLSGVADRDGQAGATLEPRRAGPGPLRRRRRAAERRRAVAEDAQGHRSRARLRARRRT